MFENKINLKKKMILTKNRNSAADYFDLFSRVTQSKLILFLFPTII